MNSKENDNRTFNTGSLSDWRETLESRISKDPRPELYQELGWVVIALEDMQE